MTKKILIVDDESDIRESVRALIESEGFQVTVAGSGLKALDVLKTQKFDLVLMDIFMPEMSGKETVQKIRENPSLQDQKVAFLTIAKLSEAGETVIKKLNPVAYITKPIVVEEFITQLRELLGTENKAPEKMPKKVSTPKPEKKKVSTKRVLIVDDESDIRDSVKMLIEIEGFKATAVSSGQGALEVLKTQKFDLVLMDIFMPEMSGKETVQKIRENPSLQDQKVAFLTIAKLSEAGETVIKKLNPVAYITKPIVVEEFITQLKELLKE